MIDIRYIDQVPTTKVLVKIKRLQAEAREAVKELERSSSVTPERLRTLEKGLGACHWMLGRYRNLLDRYTSGICRGV